MTLRDMTAQAINGATDALNTCYNTLYGIGAGALSGVATFTKPVVQPVVNFVQPVTQTVSSKVAALWAFLKPHLAALYAFATTPMGASLVFITAAYMFSQATKFTQKDTIPYHFLQVVSIVFALCAAINFGTVVSQSGWLSRWQAAPIAARAAV